jgi:hypothetical protein
VRIRVNVALRPLGESDNFLQSVKHFFVHRFLVIPTPSGGDRAEKVRGSMLLMFFVECTTDNFAHWLRCVDVWNVSNAAAVSVLASSAKSRNFPVMMCAEVRAVFAERHHPSRSALSRAISTASST